MSRFVIEERAGEPEHIVNQEGLMFGKPLETREAVQETLRVLVMRSPGRYAPDSGNRLVAIGPDHCVLPEDEVQP